MIHNSVDVDTVLNIGDEIYYSDLGWTKITKIEPGGDPQDDLFAEHTPDALTVTGVWYTIPRDRFYGTVAVKNEDITQPYLTTTVTRVERHFNPNYDDVDCECGHPYERHFDSYESMSAVGCKYCGCCDFKPKT